MGRTIGRMAASWLVLGGVMVAGCRATPRTTPALLQAGEGETCTRPEVRAGLTAALRSRVGAVRVGYDQTALMSFDAATKHMICTTRAAWRIGELTRRAVVQYAVVPSLDDHAAVVVTPDAASLAALPAAAPTPLPAASPTAPPAVLTEADLAGDYVDDVGPETSCDTDNNYRFFADHRYAGFLDNGRWTLRGDVLTVRGTSPADEEESSPAQPFTYTWTIRERTARGFSARVDDGSTARFFRCP